MGKREIPRYAGFMLKERSVVTALEGSTKYAATLERKQTEWMKRKGIE